MADPIYPAVPTRIVEPVVSIETAVPTPAVCLDCTTSGNEALAKAGRRSKPRLVPMTADQDHDEPAEAEETES